MPAALAIFAVALPDGRPLQLGLQNLAQQCAQLPRDRWATFIDDHIDTLDRRTVRIRTGVVSLTPGALAA